MTTTFVRPIVISAWLVASSGIAQTVDPGMEEDVPAPLVQTAPEATLEPVLSEIAEGGEAPLGFSVEEMSAPESVAPMPEGQAAGAGEQPALSPANRLFGVVGAVDLNVYYYWELELPAFIRDADGGTIRLIMQHEIDGLDQIRVIDEHIATEFDNDAFGRRGRFQGRYGWTRQSGGGDHAWILGDGTAHNLATPWGWAWITDYRWLQDGGVLGGDRIRIYSHPHVTTRVVFMD